MTTDETTHRAVSTSLPARPAPVGTGGEELDRILASRDVFSLFQPIVDLGSGEPLAYEALSRGPLDSPLHRADLLFAAAREAGRIDDLDELCRGRAFEAMVDSSLQAPYVLFVNREPSTVSGNALTPQHLTILRRRGLRVVMELTERDLSHHPAELLAFAARIRAAGMGIALDDVGVDADSLALMPFLMPDVIKLDMGLLRARPDTAGVQVVSAVRAHAERRGTVILAEGIETEEQERLAVAMGATLGQGWRYGRPAPLPGAEQLRAARVRTLPSRPVVLRDPDPELAAASPFEMATRTIAPIRGPLDLLAALRRQMEHEVAATNGLAVVLTTCIDPPIIAPECAENFVELARAARFAAALGRDVPDEIAPGLRGSPVPAEDPISGEWNLVVVSPHSAVGLVARERPDPYADEGRAFDYVLTYDRPLVVDMARALMMRALPLPGPEVTPPDTIDALLTGDLMTMPDHGAVTTAPPGRERDGARRVPPGRSRRSGPGAARRDGDHEGVRLPRRFRPPPRRRSPEGADEIAVVAVPGLGLSVDGWRAPLTLLAPDAAAAAVALPAFGLPAAPHQPLDPPTSAVRLLEALDEPGVGPAVLIGHSASSQVVAEVARHAPGRVSGLVLVGPTTDPLGATWPRLTRRWLATAAREPLGQVPLLARDYTYSGLVTFARAMDAARRHDLEEALTGVRCPVLVLRGVRDDLSPVSWTDRLGARPGVRARTLPVGAHLLPLTHPHELVAAMRSFVVGPPTTNAMRARTALPARSVQLDERHHHRPVDVMVVTPTG